jgi:hypothetical protein
MGQIPTTRYTPPHPYFLVLEQTFTMNRIGILLLALFTSTITLAQNGIDWKQMQLKGKVKSMELQETYRYKKNGVAFTPWEKTYARTHQFDNTGRYTLFEEKKSDGTGGYKIRYTNNIKEKNIRQAYFNKDDQPTFSKAITLDDKGRKIEEQEFTTDGKFDRSYSYTYDAKGNNVTLIGKRADGSISTKYNWTYDDKGNKTDLKLETTGYADSYQNYSYDAKGNLTGEAWFDGKKQITFRFERMYDDKGNVIEELKYKNGTQFLHKSTWVYEYDKQGNWTKKTQFSNGEDFFITERKIVYY